MILHLVLKSKGWVRNRLTTGYNPVVCGGLKPFHVIIVLMIFASSLIAGYESYLKFLHPEPLRYVWWVMAAAIVGFVGNEG